MNTMAKAKQMHESTPNDMSKMGWETSVTQLQSSVVDIGGTVESVVITEGS